MKPTVESLRANVREKAHALDEALLAYSEMRRRSAEALEKSARIRDQKSEEYVDAFKELRAAQEGGAN